MLFLKTFKDAKFVVDGNALVANKRVGNSAAEMTARELAMRLVTRVSTVQSAEQVPAAGRPGASSLSRRRAD